MCIRDRRALDGLTDSKKLTARKRCLLFDALVDTALAYSVVHIPAAEIDRRGIQAANLDGARRAIAGLGDLSGRHDRRWSAGTRTGWAAVCRRECRRSGKNTV